MSAPIGEAAKKAVKALRRYLEPEGAYRFVMEQFFADLPAICPPGDRQPDLWQKKMLLAFGAKDAAGKATYRRMLAIACKGPGKTALLAWIGWYFLATRPHCKVPCISITGGNLKDGLWSELAKWQKRSPFLLKAFTWFAERITNNRHPSTWFASKRSWSPDADPASQATDIAGLHEDFLLWLIDECSDMPQGVVDAALAALTSGIETRVVMMGNATQTDGPLYNAVTNEADRWHITRITGDPDDPERSPRIDIEEARREIASKGRDDYRVRVNILGLFPERQADKLLDMRDVQDAQNREIGDAGFIHDPKVMGCDVAYFGGDASIICPRQGLMTFKLKEFRDLATDEYADQIVAFSNKWEADGCFVDATGIGTGVVDSLRRMGFEARAIHNAQKAIAVEQYENKRAECYALAADWVRKGGVLPRDPLLATELTAPRYWYRKGRMIIEPKEDIKARLGRSPDRADAFVLTFAGPVKRKARFSGIGPHRVRVPEGLDSGHGQRRAKGIDYDVLDGS